MQEEIRKDIRLKLNQNKVEKPLSETAIHNYSRVISKMLRSGFVSQIQQAETLKKMAGAGVAFHRAMKNLGLR
jgi:hypothetical protein